MSPVNPPEPAGEPGWEPVAPFPEPVTAGRFVSGDGQGERFRVAWFRRPGDPGLVGKVWLGPGTEGPPRHVHGGSLAAVLDEVMSGACWSRGLRVVSARLEVDYRAPVPLGTVAGFAARLVSSEGRKHFTAARLEDGEGLLLAEARGIFVELTDEQLAAFADGDR